MIVLLTIFAVTRAYPRVMIVDQRAVGLQSSLVLSLDQLQSHSCNDPNNCRSLWDIIRSCVLTVFLCIWVSVHPNIPSPDDGWPRVTLRRVGLMLATLFVPEAIIAWALRQRLAAGKLAKVHEGEGWTLAHGFFATMGGFMKYEGNRPVRVLFPEELRSYSLTGNGDFPRISKIEIQDKSKGDFISKGVVILQTSWFVMQCIARGVQGLPITELELATIAFAGLNFVIYLLWWDKPLNVQCGVRVYEKRSTNEHIDDGHVEATAGFWVALGDALSMLPAAIIRGPVVRDMIFWSQSWPWLARVLTWPVIKPLNIIGGRDYRRMEKRVGTFYPPEWDGYWIDKLPIALIIAGIASAFGGIHCIGWSFTFPSSIERTLWRIASMSITSLPITLFLLLFLIDEWDPFQALLTRLPYRVPKSVILSVSGLQLFFYVLSRLVLLILPFVSLRLLPPAAYHTVRWTSFVPHI